MIQVQYWYTSFPLEHRPDVRSVDADLLSEQNEDNHLELGGGVEELVKGQLFAKRGGFRDYGRVRDVIDDVVLYKHRAEGVGLGGDAYEAWRDGNRSGETTIRVPIYAKYDICGPSYMLVSKTIPGAKRIAGT